MEEKKNVFKVLDEHGNEHEFELLFTVESDETGKNYMVYTDNTTDENGNVKTYASIFDPTSEQSKLEPITTEKEWKTITDILEKFNTENKDEQ